MPHNTRIVEDPTLEPIAIVGMSCRLPGSIDSAPRLWDLLVRKGSVQTPQVPSNRFNIDAYFHEDLDRPGSFNVPGGYFLDGSPDDFDPSFFNVTPIEAMWMDPQQRKMLEVCYECLESGGLTLADVSGSNTAVFVGSFTSDYQQMSIRDPDFRHNYAATGVDTGIISNRIGNTFDLRGPSFTINTACSSSIYAIHNACHALRAHDCEAAIAGGVNLIMTVDQHMNTAKLGILSPTSTCHTFDASADGYGRAEGAGALYLKRLGDAIRDGNPIRGVIRSSAVNTNGKVAGIGITHPSVSGQERVVRMAYQKASLEQSKTAYLECHGTGTPVGDPIEARAVSKAMNDNRSPETPLIIGAIKASIGHSEAASGIFAVMKAALVTERGVIPGVAGLKKLNPAIDEKGWNVKVQKDTAPWPAGFSPRRAGVSSFGYGGTNGHIIIEEVNALFPEYQQGKAINEATYDNQAARPFMVFFSAHDRITLQRNIEAHAKVAHDFFMADLAHTLNTRRTKFPHRAFTVAHQMDQDNSFNISSFSFASVTKKLGQDVAFVFTGQGAQWAGMALEAMNTFPSFLETLRKLDRVLQKLDPPAAWRLEDILRSPGEPSLINDAEVSQPICTAIQIAIIDLLKRWKIHPTVTVGHSSGEIAAAYAAGFVSAPEAIVAAFYRGYAVKHHAPPGTMLAVGQGVEATADLIGDFPDIVIACENSPDSVTLSGKSEAIQKVKARLDGLSIFARELRTGQAYHSPLMDGVASVYDELLSRSQESLCFEDFDWRLPRARMISSVTGMELKAYDLPDRYWSHNLRNRVRFGTAISTLATQSGLEHVRYMIEIGPHSTLAGPLQQIFSANQFDRFTYIPTFLRKMDSAVQLLKTAGELFLRDYPLDVQQVNAIDDSNRNTASDITRQPLLLVDLPPYQWNYDKKYWAEARFSQEQRRMKFPRHDLLGRRIAGLSEHSLVWRNVLVHKNVPWLKDHALGNVPVFPAAAHMSLAIEALRQVCEIRGFEVDGVVLRDINISTALIIPETDDGVEIQLRLQENLKSTSTSTWYSFAVESIVNDRWTLHCEGSVAACQSSDLRDPSSPVDVSKLTQRASRKKWYDAFHRVGFQYQGSFQPLHQIRTNQKYYHASAQIQTATESGMMRAESRYLLHPSTVDACLQLIIISVYAGQHKKMHYGLVPIEIEELKLWFPTDEVDSRGHAVAWTDEINGRYVNTHTKLFTGGNRLLLDVKNLRCVAYEGAVPPEASISITEAPYSQVDWKPDISTLTTTDALQLYPALNSEVDCIDKIVELLDHETPLHRILCLGHQDADFVSNCTHSVSSSTVVSVGYSSKELLEAFRSAEHRFFMIDISSGTWSDFRTQDYDLVIVDKSMMTLEQSHELVQELQLLVQRGGKAILSIKSTAARKSLDAFGFPNVQMRFDFPETSVIIPKSGVYQDGAVHRMEEVTLLTSQKQPASLGLFVEQLKCEDCLVAIATLAEFIDDKDHKIILFDIEGQLLNQLDVETFENLKHILCSGKPIIWLTAGVNEGKSVFGGMTQGFLRAIRLELASARILHLDVDTKESMESVAGFVRSKLGKIVTKDSGSDTEFYLKEGIIHIGRIVPNEPLNSIHSGLQRPLESSTLPPHVPLKGAFVEGELVFSPSRSHGSPDLHPDEVELQVNYSEIHTRSQDPLLIIGTVVSLGTSVDHVLRDQRVIAYTKDSLCTLVRVPATSCISCGDLDAAQLLAVLPSFCKAVNALIGSAKVQNQEHVLLLPAPLPVIWSTIMLSRFIGFRLTIVADAKATRDSYVDKFQLPSESVVLSQDVEALMQRGSDAPMVVVAHEFSALSQSIWRSMPSMGRFVFNDTSIRQTPDVLPLTRGASFFSTSIEILYKRAGNLLFHVLRQSLDMFKEHMNKLTRDVPMFDIGSLKDDADSGVASLDYDQSLIKIQPALKEAHFPSDATYILVGCLGGLGRSLTVWMMERGCRSFAFISRSGAEKPEARQVVETLVNAGASVRVFKADASNEKEVADIVAELTASQTIRGVVHAAMVLQDGMYEQMTYDRFAAGTIPKVQGALSLHNALKETPLDFFVMTSSLTAVLGNSGQSNYCAGNSFLDSLAWHRNLLGLAATSIALPMVLDVGVVAENESIEASLGRTGMYGIDEDEMLRAFEVAMLQTLPIHPSTPKQGNAQIILGLEPARLSKKIPSKYRVEPRLKAVLAGLDAPSKLGATKAESSSIGQLQDIAAASKIGTMKAESSFLAKLQDAAAVSAEVAIGEIGAYIMARCSKILMRDVEEFEMDGKSVAEHGLDSMIGAELRNWLFKEFTLDMPFQKLLAPELTFRALSVAVGEKLGVCGEGR